MSVNYELEDAIKLALHKTIELLGSIDNRYHEAAFPIVLSTLLSPVTSHRVSTHNSGQVVNQERVELQKPKIAANYSIGEFLRKAAPKSHKARFVCIAYFLLHSGKSDQFSVADIIDGYNKARSPKPVNSADVIAQCIKGVLITDSSNSNSKNKTWVITDSGEAYVEELLNGSSK